MKFIKPFLITIILFSCAGSGIIQNENKLIGEWNGTDYWNNKSDLIFSIERDVSLTVNGQKIGGKDFEVNGVKAELKYELDKSKKPIWIDLIALEKETKIEKGRIKGILKFIDENNAEILLSFNGERFENFDEKSEQSIIKMNRKK